jgi:hypothetical protein
MRVALRMKRREGSGKTWGADFISHYQRGNEDGDFHDGKPLPWTGGLRHISCRAIYLLTMEYTLFGII